MYLCVYIYIQAKLLGLLGVEITTKSISIPHKVQSPMSNLYKDIPFVSNLLKNYQLVTKMSHLDQGLCISSHILYSILERNQNKTRFTIGPTKVFSSKLLSLSICHSHLKLLSLSICHSHLK